MNKFILFGIVLLVFFSLTNNVKASSWGLPRCGTWGDIGFGCCNDVCELGERACDKEMGISNYLVKCGDYDTLWDWDQCYEWPPDDESYWDYCSYGCRNSQCWNTNPCGVGGECIQGDTRCGSTQRGGSSVEAVFKCEYNDEVGCWLWGVDPIQVCELPLYTECGSGQCVTYGQRQENQCAKRETECEGRFIKGCEDPNMDNHWTWQNPNDWYPCEHGCTMENGRGQCVYASGEASGITCISDRTRCNPGFLDYTQECVDNEWVIDPDPDPERECFFGCHLGSCNRDPDPEIACYNCTLGDTRCAGRGEYVRECAFDPYTGCLAWVKSWPCESGRCENDVCVERSQYGYDVDISGLGIANPRGIAHNEGGFYIYGVNSSKRYIFRFNSDWSYVSKFQLIGIENTTVSDLSTDGSNLWAIFLGTSDSYFTLANFTSNGTVIGIRNVSHADMSDVGITIDDDFFYIFGDENGVVKFHRVNYTDASDDICLVSSDNQGCQDWHEEYIAIANEKIHIIQQPSQGNPKIEIYGLDGYYYGFFNLTETTGRYYSGIDYLNNIFYFLYNDGNIIRIEARYDFTVCQNECFNESSMCGGFSNNYIIPCVQDANDCWKWYQGDWTCTLTGTCNTTQCIYGCYERWENHRIKKAYCESSPSCEDICEPEEVSCSGDGKSVMECEYRHVWQTFENEIIPVAGQCWIWEDFTDWENCGWGECIEGHCVQSSKCTVNETKCFVSTALSPLNVMGSEYVVTCRDVNNDSYYEWDIYSMDFCYWGCNETIVNATTDQSIATCINASGDFLNIKNTIAESSVWMGIMFSDPISKYILILIMNMLIFGLFTFYGQWEFGLLGISTVTIMASLLGWMPFEVIIIGIVFAGVFIYTKIAGGG